MSTLVTVAQFIAGVVAVVIGALLTGTFVHFSERAHRHRDYRVAAYLDALVLLRRFEQAVTGFLDGWQLPDKSSLPTPTESSAVALRLLLVGSDKAAGAFEQAAVLLRDLMLVMGDEVDALRSTEEKSEGWDTSDLYAHLSSVAAPAREKLDEAQDSLFQLAQAEVLGRRVRLWGRK
ncbi:MAG TPA: hypothetical protein VMM60_09070 [Ilumatobacter sp.]|nr:hypothetical protein [Ilumatobacter sp.]